MYVTLLNVFVAVFVNGVLIVAPPGIVPPAGIVCSVPSAKVTWTSTVVGWLLWGLAPAGTWLPVTKRTLFRTTLPVPFTSTFPSLAITVFAGILSTGL